MKIRFSKVATLFLAGAAVLAAGCTDYQSDINDIYVKIDELASKESVASLQSQVVVLSNALDALKSDHSKDIDALKTSISALQAADAQFTSQIAVLDGKIGDNGKNIAALQSALANTDKTVDALAAAFSAYKTEVSNALKDLSAKDAELAGKIETAETALRGEIAAVQKLVETEAANRADADKVLGERIDAAVKAAADNLAAAESRLNDKIGAEATRAQLAEKELKDAIAAEVAAREAADKAAAEALAAEVKRAEDAEKLLDEAIKAEAAARDAADVVLTKRIAAEERAREVADSLLSEAIKAEAIARDEAIKVAVEAEAIARIKADSALQAYAENIDKKVDDLNKEYTAFKATVEGEIAGLKTRLDAAETAIKNIEASIKTINGQIKDLQKTDSLLRVDMEAGDKLVLDSLNLFKAATEKSIAALQVAVKDIVAVNKDQSDSLKAAFAKFNDYVLTTTFEAYQNEVEAALKAKADTAALNAAVKKIDSLDTRIVALEAYKNQLVDEIIPGLEDADKALKASIDSLGGVVAEVKENVDTLNSHMAKAEAIIANHSAAIADLLDRTSALEEWQIEAEQNIQSLLGRIRSVEFVPDYTDKYATIELAFMETAEKVTIEDGITDDSEFYWDHYFKAFYTPSQITYKVYPVEMADTLVSYFKKHANDEAVYFDVIKLKNSGSRFDNESEVQNLPKLEIIDVQRSDRTKGAITFTVLPKNVDDFKVVWEDAANFVAYGRDHGSLQDRILTTAEKIALMISSDHTQLLSKILGFYNKYEEEKFEPFYSSALVIEGVDGGAITSEYNVWTAGISSIFESPWFGINDPAKYDEWYDDNKWYPYIKASYLNKEVEYTDTLIYSIADSVELVSTYTIRGEESKTDKFENVVKILNVDLKADVAATREYSFEGTDNETLFKDVFTKSPASEFGEYGLNVDRKPFTPEFNEFVKLKSRLNPDCDVQTRRKAIGESEYTTYEAGVLGMVTDYFETEFTITKTQAKAVVEPIVINWEYGQDVATDAAIFHGGANDGEGDYSRTGIVLTINEEESNLTEKGVQIADFDGASSVIKDYVVKNSKGEVVTDLDIKLELSADKKSVLADISNFAWDETYTITATYDLEDAVVSVSGSIQTIDRPRTPIVVDFGTYEKVYAKDMAFNIRGCMTYGDAKPLADHNVNVAFDASPVDVQKLIVDLYGETAKVPAKLAADLWAHKTEFVGTADAGKAFVNVKDTCNNAIFAISYADYQKPEKDTLTTKFYLYYGQEIDVVAVIDVKAPKYDFRHNIYRVFDNGTTEAESHPTSNVKVSGRFYSNVEPAYTADKWNGFEHFDVAAINLPEAFVVVNDSLLTISPEDQVAAGLKVSFELESVPACQNDGRDNTYITIENNKLKYHGWDEKVAVYGSMAIVNSDSSEFKFPTSFDEGFEAIYAAKLGEGEPTVGRYAEYEVVKFNPLHDFKSTEDVTLQVFDAKMYTTNVLEKLSLLDQRKYDANDPTMPTSVTGIDNGVELFDGQGNWKLGDGSNLFANDIRANKAYDIESEFKKEIADDVHEDIKNAVKLRTEQDVVVFEFDYTQQIVLTQPVLVKVNAELTQPWAEKPLTATVNVTIKK